MCGFITAGFLVHGLHAASSVLLYGVTSKIKATNQLVNTSLDSRCHKANEAIGKASDWQPSHGSTSALATLSSQSKNLYLPSVCLRRGWVWQKGKQCTAKHCAKVKNKLASNSNVASAITIAAEAQSFPS